MRRPSDLALVLTPLGEIALHSDGDVLLTYTGDVLRIYNISALGNDCKVKFGREVIGENKSECVKLKVGFEIVASTHKLGRVDLRPADGVARRRAQLLNNGHMAISEFSVQSVLSNSAVIVQIAQQSTNAKEARVLSQMSKMAAVLNYVNSPYGYTVEGATGVASAPGKQPL